jgi:hypothetical protein
MNVLAISGQKFTKHGKPIVNLNGLPVYKGSVEKRLKIMREILSFGATKESKSNDKWDNIVSECKLKVA